MDDEVNATDKRALSRGQEQIWFKQVKLEATQIENLNGAISWTRT